MDGVCERHGVARDVFFRRPQSKAVGDARADLWARLRGLEKPPRYKQIANWFDSDEATVRTTVSRRRQKAAA